MAIYQNGHRKTVGYYTKSQLLQQLSIFFLPNFFIKENLLQTCPMYDITKQLHYTEISYRHLLQSHAFN